MEFKEFAKCPACGSEERFFESIVKELKEAGKCSDDFEFPYDQRTGIVAEKEKMEAMLIGAEIPCYSFSTDICCECGLIYVTKLGRGTAKKTATPLTFPPETTLPGNIHLN